MPTIESLVDEATKQAGETLPGAWRASPLKESFSQFISRGISGAIARRFADAGTPISLALKFSADGHNTARIRGILMMSNETLEIGGNVSLPPGGGRRKFDGVVAAVSLTRRAEAERQAHERKLHVRTARALGRLFGRARQRLGFGKKKALFEDEFDRHWEEAHRPDDYRKPYADRVYNAIIKSQGPKSHARAFHRLMTVGGKVAPLRQDESAVVTLVHAKIAAVLYDRVWDAVTLWEPRAPLEVLFHTSESMYGIQFTWMQDRDLTPQAVAEEFRRNADDYEPALPRIVKAVDDELNTTVVPLFMSSQAFQAAHSAGVRETLALALSGLDFINEDRLEWEQVLEIRHDKDSRVALRRFLRWADSTFLRQKEQVIREELEARYKTYRAALEKHGATTAKGFVETVVDVRTLLSGVGAMGLATKLTTNTVLRTEEALVETLAGLAFTLGSATVSFRKRRSDQRLERLQLAQNYPDMAILTRLGR